MLHGGNFSSLVSGMLIVGFNANVCSCAVFSGKNLNKCADFFLKFASFPCKTGASAYIKSKDKKVNTLQKSFEKVDNKDEKTKIGVKVEDLKKYVESDKSWVYLYWRKVSVGAALLFCGVSFTKFLYNLAAKNNGNCADITKIKSEHCNSKYETTKTDVKDAKNKINEKEKVEESSLNETTKTSSEDIKNETNEEEKVEESNLDETSKVGGKDIKNETNEEEKVEESNLDETSKVGGKDIENETNKEEKVEESNLGETSKIGSEDIENETNEKEKVEESSLNETTKTSKEEKVEESNLGETPKIGSEDIENETNEEEKVTKNSESGNVSVDNEKNLKNAEQQSLIVLISIIGVEIVIIIALLSWWYCLNSKNKANLVHVDSVPINNDSPITEDD